MKSKKSKFLFFIFLVLLVALFALYLSGIRVNTSGSVPEGIYKIENKKSKKIEVGDYVMFCPPLNHASIFNMAFQRNYIDSGFCAGGYGHLIKVVFGMQGDTVKINSAGVRVNNHLLPYSKPLPFDGAGRGLPKIDLTNYVLKPDEFLLMTNQSALSFDARYFGILRLKDVTVLRPLWLFKKEE